MTNLHDRDRINLATFLRDNKPIPPQARSGLERQIIDSLEPRKFRDRKYYKTVTCTIPSAIATGFLFTTVSFGVRTPRVAIEPQDLENFLVNNWQNTFDTYNNASVTSNSEVDWLLPTVSESEPALSVSAK